jgi:hypothetical protein
MFGCDYISYGLILLRFWVCVLIIMARESIFRSVYYPNLFLVFVVSVFRNKESKIKIAINSKNKKLREQTGNATFRMRKACVEDQAMYT